MECTPPTIGEPVDGRACEQTLGLDTEKKTLGATQRDEAARTAYRAQGARYDQERVVGVDACGSTINLTPSYARAPKGERAVDRVPRNTEQNTPLIAAMTTQGMGAAMLLDGATDGLAFEPDVDHFVGPTLVPATSWSWTPCVRTSVVVSGK
jgi:hypothetical protein